MTSKDSLKLAKILARTESPFAGEREAARRLASAFLAKHRHPTPTTPVADTRTERRKSHVEWRGYCRRRRTGSGAALNIAA